MKARQTTGTTPRYLVGGNKSVKEPGLKNTTRRITIEGVSV